jgi:hypothetical protein
MILYNVTIGIDKAIQAEWLSWMKEEHIPEVMDTGVFESFKFYKVLSHDDENTESYCIQYFTPSIEKFNYYIQQLAPLLVEKHRAKFKDHVAFRTLLEEIE